MVPRQASDPPSRSQAIPLMKRASSPARKHARFDHPRTVADDADAVGASSTATPRISAATPALEAE